VASIVVSEWVKKRLFEIKEKEGHKTIDSVIRSLIPPSIVEEARRRNGTVREDERRRKERELY
jgi:hypothetical protein